jgi:hypothetical protein
VQAAAAADGAHVSQPGITVEDTDKRDFSPAGLTPVASADPARPSSSGQPATMEDLGMAKKADTDDL